MCCDELQSLLAADSKCVTPAKETPAEQHKQFLIDLPKGSQEVFCRVHVDDCLIPQTTPQERCDYVFKRCANGEFYFVELKGSNVGKAVEQIVATIDFFKKRLKKEHTMKQDKILGFIVASKVKSPKTNAKINKLKTEFKRKHGKDLQLKSEKLHYTPTPLT